MTNSLIFMTDDNYQWLNSAVFMVFLIDHKIV